MGLNKPGSAVSNVAFSVASTNLDLVSGDSISNQMGQIQKHFVDYDTKKYNPNLLINGDFQIWQRATTQSSIGYGSDDRWNNYHDTSTKVHSQQAFTIGQSVVSDNPLYFSRTVVTSVVNTISRVLKTQKIEDVTKTAGKTLTLSFWAKADSNKNMSVDFAQNFGSGGSSAVVGIGVTKLALTTTWQKFVVNVTIPSISGLTVGVGHYLELVFWFDAGSSFNSRTNTLGQQSGTFDIANVKLEVGSFATTFIPSSYNDTLLDCKRYYEKLSAGALVYAVATSQVLWEYLIFSVEKRVAPTVTPGTLTSATNQGTITADVVTSKGFRALSSNVAIGVAYFISEFIADAEL